MNKAARSLVRAIPGPVRRVLRGILGRTLSAKVAGGLGIRKSPSVRQLHDKLWSGFSHRAKLELAKIAESSPNTANAVAAALDLASWHATHGEVLMSLHYAALARHKSQDSPLGIRQVLLEADAHAQTQHAETARQLLIQALEQHPGSTVLELAMANTFVTPERCALEANASDSVRLEWMNRSLEAAGIAPLRKIDPNGPLALDNLTADAPKLSAIDGASPPLVSIIIPAYSAAATLGMTLDSLRRQTWQELEILVVDDCSPDDTLEVAQAYAQRDPRIVVVRQTSNRGAYAARNAGLRLATGEFVTVHDADDWSHPQKIEFQIRDLLKHPAVPANLTDWIRCYPSLYFRPRARAFLTWIHYNHSSLMLRRELLLKMGGWDEVRIGADSELIRRIEHGQAQGPIRRVHPGIPLSFALVEGTSLTQQSLTHAKTIRYGVRRTYLEASTHWLRKQPVEFVSVAAEGLPTSTVTRPFPVPGFILPKKTEAELDVLIVSDFTRHKCDVEAILGHALELERTGKKVGLCQWFRYSSNVSSRLPESIMDLVQAGRVYLLSPGETAQVHWIFLYDPLVVNDIVDLPPKLKVSRGSLARVVDGRELSPAVQEALQKRVAEWFGFQPAWFDPKSVWSGDSKPD